MALLILFIIQYNLLRYSFKQVNVSNNTNPLNEDLVILDAENQQEKEELDNIQQIQWLQDEEALTQIGLYLGLLEFVPHISNLIVNLGLLEFVPNINNLTRVGKEIKQPYTFSK